VRRRTVVPPPGRRFFAIVFLLAVVLLAMSALYLAGMEHLEEKPRNFWQALQWAAGTTSTTGYSVDTSWKHPVMVVYVVVAQFVGVALFFVVLPGFLLRFLESRFETKLPTQADGLRDHVVIFDHDATVTTLLAELKQARIPAIIVDEDEAEVRHLLAQGHRAIHGDLDEGVLDKCSLRYARALVVNSSDDRNAATILAARQAGYTGEIIALVEDPFHRHPMLLAGASDAYTPRHVLGAALAARASEKVSPTVAGVQHLGDKLQVAEARVARDSPLAGKRLDETGLGAHASVAVIGQWIGGRLVSPPAPGMRLWPGGILVLVGSDDGIRDFVRLCEGAHRLRRTGPFVIAGYGEVGRKVAQLLTDAGEKTFVIDRKPGPGVDLVGSVLDTQVLAQAGLADAQAVILAPDTDSTAIFGTVIVRDLAPEVPVVARVNVAENVERLYAAGADFALSVSQVSGQLLAFRLLGKESVSIDPELRVEKVPARGLERFHPRQPELRELTGCTVIAVERGGELLVAFEPDFVLRPDDIAYVCGSADATQAFGRMFAPAQAA
jgi:Trk K+ transport system NAD-binding subunit